ncbi:MAG TPA: hypothetical protein VIV12_08690 [Streptosporangiaceae bacterium]
MIATVYVNGGLWVAMCPRPGCHNAEMFGRCTDGSVGGLSGGSFRCRAEKGGCGLVCDASWPPNVDDIERLLKLRPVPATRNWLPTETLEDLLVENATHGCLPPELEAGGSLSIVGGRMSQVQLDGARLELEAG